MQVHRAEFRIDVRNARANGALRKLGATQEGLLRRALHRDGVFVDQVLWAIVAGDWCGPRDVSPSPAFTSQRTSVSARAFPGVPGPLFCTAGGQNAKMGRGPSGPPAVSASLRVSDFDFDLPHDLVAQEPPATRGTSRLMRLGRVSGAIGHGTFADLPSLLAPGDLLVLNDTRVFPARLLGRRLPGGGAVECLLASRLDDDAGDPASETWVALVSPGPRVKTGTRMVFEGEGGALHGEVLERGAHGRVVRLTTDDGTPVRDAVHRLGHIPLPPYIKRADVPADRERYQTVYGRREGLHCRAHGGSALHAGAAGRHRRRRHRTHRRSRCMSATAPFSPCGSTSWPITAWRARSTRSAPTRPPH